jgi:hypothetical protein
MKSQFENLERVNFIPVDEDGYCSQDSILYTFTNYSYS